MIHRKVLDNLEFLMIEISRDMFKKVIDPKKIEEIAKIEEAEKGASEMSHYMQRQANLSVILAMALVTSLTSNHEEIHQIKNNIMCEANEIEDDCA